MDLLRMEVPEGKSSNTIATKAEKKLEKLCEIAGLTEDGELWVKQTLDPFNDEDRRKVGYPDVITGKSVIQKVPVSGTYVVGAAAEDVHIYLDSIDTPCFLYENTKFVDGGAFRSGNYAMDATLGIGSSRAGGICVRKGAAGTDLDQSTAINFGGPNGPVGLDNTYLTGCGARVIAKGLEVVNATPKLTVGGSVRCYRATGNVPYDDTEVVCMRNSATPLTTMNVVEGRTLQTPPKNVGEVELYTDHTFWNASEGAMVVAIPSAQTNEPRDEFNVIMIGKDSVATPTKRWISGTGPTGGGSIPAVVVTGNSQVMASPFYLCGAYFTGLPPGSILDVRGFYYIERFVDSTQKDLVILANPSPHYDPLALELMSKTAMKLPCGTRVKNNASGDWLKTVADIAGAFGVPGMPLVRGAIDLYQGARKVYKNFNNPNSGMQSNSNGMKMIEEANLERKFNQKNNKRQQKGKAPKNKEAYVAKKNLTKAQKKAAREARAGLASGGSM